jgi:hypothetical protein
VNGEWRMALLLGRKGSGPFPGFFFFFFFFGGEIFAIF